MPRGSSIHASSLRPSVSRPWPHGCTHGRTRIRVASSAISSPTPRSHYPLPLFYLFSSAYRTLSSTFLSLAKPFDISLSFPISLNRSTSTAFPLRFSSIRGDARDPLDRRTTTSQRLTIEREKERFANDRRKSRKERSGRKMNSRRWKRGRESGARYKSTWLGSTRVTRSRNLQREDYVASILLSAEERFHRYAGKPGP